VPERSSRPTLREVREELRRLYTMLDRTGVGAPRQVIKGRIQALEWVTYGKTMEE
jgi:hypothetical protein